MQVVHVAATHKMEIAFLLHSFRRRRPSLELSPLGVVRPTETTAHNASVNSNCDCAHAPPGLTPGH